MPRRNRDRHRQQTQKDERLRARKTHLENAAAAARDPKRVARRI